MQQIKIPKSFFVKERDNLYSDWMTAFWREMLQNSIDAGSDNIWLSLGMDGDTVCAYVEDDGCGMSREVLEDVYFALGETTKTGSGTTGGFGRARILTCFAMESYNIWTKDFGASGDGANYEIEDAKVTRQKGCRFEIFIGKYGMQDLADALVKVLRMSQIECNVHVNFGNGEGSQRWTDWLHRRRLVKTASYGNIHVNKSGNILNQVIVRVNGLWMYSIYTDAKAQVIVEIDPSKSRDVLTVNRDGMHYKYSNDLQSFVNELAVDTRSALRANRRKTRLIHGIGSRFSENKKYDREPTWAGAAGGFNKGETTETQKTGALTAAFQMTANRATSIAEFDREDIHGQQIVDDLPHIYINDETDPYDMSHSKVRAVIERFDPTNWTHCVREIRGKTSHYRKGSSYLKLLMTWETCCMYAIECLLESGVSLDRVQWLIGWTFSFDDGACHVHLSEGHALCLNPVSNDGTLRYKIRDKKDQIRLMALAKHEVAHIMHSYHNEDYAGTLTEIDMRFDATECFRRIRKSLVA